MNYYTQFSVRIPEKGQQLFELLDHYKALTGPYSGGFDMTDKELGAIISAADEINHGVELRKEDEDFYLEDDCGEPHWDAVIPLIQLWMKRCDIKQVLPIQYANTASRHTPDAFGGGVLFIWPDDSLSIDSNDLLHADVPAMRKVFNYE